MADFLRRPSWALLGRRWLIGAAAGLIGLIGLVWLIATYWPDGVDYHYTFYPTARLWLEDKTRLYDAPSAGFFHPPWVIWTMAGLALLPYDIGRALLWIISVCGIAFSVMVFARPGKGRPWALAFALFNLHTFDLLYRGQIEAFTILGATLGWIALTKRKPLLLGLAHTLLAFTPPNSIPVALFYFWHSTQVWRAREWLSGAAIPAAAFAVSLATFGFWPSRWLEFMESTSQPINSGPGWWLVSIWRAAEQLGWPLAVPWAVAFVVVVAVVWAWRRTSGQGAEAALSRVAIILTATFVVTPYVLSYRLTLLSAVVMPWLADWRKEALVGAYLLTFLPLLRIAIGAENSWINIVFVLFMFLVALARIATRPATAPSMISENTVITPQETTHA